MSETDCNQLIQKLQDQDGSCATIDVRGYRLIRQALREVASLGTDCEIEQMVRARNVPASRQRVQIQLEHDASGAITAVRVTFEEDGEILRNWSTLQHSEIFKLLADNQGTDIGELTDRFTALYINLHTARQYICLRDIAEAKKIFDRTIPQMLAFWHQSRDYNLVRATANPNPAIDQ